MVNTRELAAIDLRFLGRTIVLLEYAFGVVLLVGLGVLGLVHTRGHSVWWWYMVGHRGELHPVALLRDRAGTFPLGRGGADAP